MKADGTTAATSNTNSPGANNTTVMGNSGGVITPPGSFTVSLYSSGNPDGALANGVISNTGGNQPHSNIQPYLTLNFCIALQGIFPSQT